MKPLRAVAALRELRGQPLWRLLAADKSVVTIALLQHVLLRADKLLPASVLYERIGNALEELRAAGEELPQTAQAYVADWLGQGWLTRRLAPGAHEEDFELSAEATAAARFVTSLLKRRTLATESRLALVQRLVLELAEKTDENPETRIDALVAERDRLDREIEAVRGGVVTALPEDRAIERAREVIALTDELAADFRRVRDDFDQLNRGLRQSLVEHEGSRGEVLEALFAGVDVIAQSDAGRTFAAFWRLLTDPDQSEALRDALELLVRRPFAKRLEARERKFLLNLTHLLGAEGSSVHDVLQNFARSLKSFVQSREFMEQRRLHTLLKRATQAALAARDAVRPTEDIGYELMLTSSRIRSLSQWSLYDPAQRMSDADMRDADLSTIDLELIGELVRQSEIDFRTLRRHLFDLLDERSPVSIAEALRRFPAEQGLGSVVGYVALGVKHGQLTPGVESVSWVGKDTSLRRAKVPAIYFSRERRHELAD
ncbi:MAG TPA: DUF3375 domain-containing protein [Polyangiaceae bacterium]|jgi:hypothetical protein|nr:DUF3375 domain-containing protein [Polyangiaceae bacterium]